MATAAIRLITAAEFAEMDLDVPAELIRGDVVEMCRPGMRHGVICNNLSYLLTAWSRGSGDGFLPVSDSGIITERDPDTVRGPDIYLLRRDRLPKEGVIAGFLETPPDLCIEVFSPSDNWTDNGLKAYEYLNAGVLEVWVIVPEDRQTYIYRPDAPPKIVPPGGDIESGAISGLKLAAADVFRDVVS
jgi:Uma2 family endonuclease